MDEGPYFLPRNYCTTFHPRPECNEIPSSLSVLCSVKVSLCVFDECTRRTTDVSALLSILLRFPCLCTVHTSCPWRSGHCHTLIDHDNPRRDPRLGLCLRGSKRLLSHKNKRSLRIWVTTPTTTARLLHHCTQQTPDSSAQWLPTLPKPSVCTPCTDTSRGTYTFPFPRPSPSECPDDSPLLNDQLLVTILHRNI